MGGGTRLRAVGRAGLPSTLCGCALRVVGSLGDARASTHFVDRKEVLAGFCMGRFLGGRRTSMVALADVCLPWVKFIVLP